MMLCLILLVVSVPSRIDVHELAGAGLHVMDAVMNAYAGAEVLGRAGVRDFPQVVLSGSISSLANSRPLGGSGRLIAEISENWVV